MPTAPQSFNGIKLTTSNEDDKNILLTEISGKLNVDASPVAISGEFGASDLSAYDFAGNGISGFMSAVSNSVETSYTLSDLDAGKILAIDHSSEVGVYIPTGISLGFNCTFIQQGEGALVFTEDGTQINNRNLHKKTSGKYAMATIVCYENNKFVLGGDTV